MVRQRAPSQSSTNSSIPERDQVCDSETLCASGDLANPRICGDIGTRQYVRLSCEDYLAWTQRVGEVSLSLAMRVHGRQQELELILLWVLGHVCYIGLSRTNVWKPPFRLVGF